MKKAVIFVSLIILLSTIYLFISLTSSNTSLSPTGNTISKENLEQEAIEELPEQNEELQDIALENPSSATAGGGAGTISEEPAPVQELDENGCFSSTVSYSLGSFQENSLCNEYSGEVCVRKITTCSAALNNLENEISGEFTIAFEFSDSQDEILLENSQTQFLEANTQKIFESSEEFSGEAATSQIKCSFKISQAPQKEICA